MTSKAYLEYLLAVTLILELIGVFGAFLTGLQNSASGTFTFVTEALSIACVLFIVYQVRQLRP